MHKAKKKNKPKRRTDSDTVMAGDFNIPLQKRAAYPNRKLATVELNFTPDQLTDST